MIYEYFLKPKIFQASESITIIILAADIISAPSFENKETTEGILFTTPSPQENLKTSYFGRRTNGSLFKTDANAGIHSVDTAILGWVETLFRLVLKQYTQHTQIVHSPYIIMILS